jgi:hypothetical protein
MRKILSAKTVSIIVTILGLIAGIIGIVYAFLPGGIFYS